MEIEYPYDKGDLIEQPNTYFYSRYQGPDFLLAWGNAREFILDRIQHRFQLKMSECSLNSPNPLVESGCQKLRQLEDIVRALREGKETEVLETIVRRFELSKRIHPNFERKFTPDKINEYRILAAYIVVAELFLVAYEHYRKVRYLNVLLKIMDTISSNIDGASVDEGRKIVWLILEERRHISNLTQTMCQKNAEK